MDVFAACCCERGLLDCESLAVSFSGLAAAVAFALVMTGAGARVGAAGADPLGLGTERGSVMLLPLLFLLPPPLLLLLEMEAARAASVVGVTVSVLSRRASGFPATTSAAIVFFVVVVVAETVVPAVDVVLVDAFALAEAAVVVAPAFGVVDLLGSLDANQDAAAAAICTERGGGGGGGGVQLPFPASPSPTPLDAVAAASIARGTASFEGFVDGLRAALCVAPPVALFVTSFWDRGSGG